MSRVPLFVSTPHFGLDAGPNARLWKSSQKRSDAELVQTLANTDETEIARIRRIGTMTFLQEQDFRDMNCKRRQARNSTLLMLQPRFENYIAI
jgi:hypothetical protein